MKKSIIITVIVALVSVMGANAQKSMDQFLIQVDGLGCPFCAYGLEKKFKEFKGIKDVEIEIETGNFSFNYPSEKNLTMDAVQQQVEKAGYTPITAKIVRANGKVETSGVSESMVAEGAKLVTKSTVVAGKCGMCEARILKSAKTVNGVSTASWDKDTQMLEVTFDSNVANLETIEKAIAKVGHDTKSHKASKDTYESLPACCLYERLDQ
ncbi:heavy-metal-associated domain-containing protein [Constantimarinum furrinae]|uniref:Heavy metal transporter n=1 Tax=Constantimarinum furrinae TaxID=2562285 RepID=A0A7G8PRW0_9FLAO|nr:heavy-metal-associated domain-containing protein [Constantimarinum furrinae]QNJ97076.1 heavy metal transporter [Constantimarinum furrinae]